MEENNIPKEEDESIAPALSEGVAPASVPAAASNDRFLPMSILIAAVVIGGAIVFATVYRGNQGNSANAPAPDAGSAAAMKLGPRDVVLGDANAPVTLIEYGDYQCPFCASFFANTKPTITKNYIDTGKVKMVFRNFIVNDRVATDHESHDAALAAECSKDQNKFWPFHDAIYNLEIKDEVANPQGAENNGNLTRAAFLGIAKSLGMDVPQFTACYDTGKYATAVQAESDQAASSYGLKATPSFLANGISVVGAEPYATFQQLFDGLLKK